VDVLVFDMSYLRGLGAAFAKAATYWKSCAKTLQMPGFHAPAGSYMLADAEIPPKQRYLLVADLQRALFRHPLSSLSRPGDATRSPNRYEYRLPCGPLRPPAASHLDLPGR
jgi:hypothetical protein